MYIHEAVKKALCEKKAIYRHLEEFGEMQIDKCEDLNIGMIFPTNSYMGCFLLSVRNFEVTKASQRWQPSAKDLMADDWQLANIKARILQ